MGIEHLLDKLEKFGMFADSHRQNGNRFLLGNHQLVPIFNAVENGLRRFVLAYGTGAGKTIVPIEVIKHLQKQGKTPKTLVIAPYRTLLENWNNGALKAHGCLINIHNVKKQKNNIIPPESNFVTVNYDKLVERLGYVEPLLEYAASADLIIADEFHNVKNKGGKASKGYQKIIDASKNARLIALSASPIPNRLSDAGIMLYTIDPDRYCHYKDHPFHIKEDPESLWEMKEQGKILFFDRQDISRFHGLPQFIEFPNLTEEGEEGKPTRVVMDSVYVRKYFEAFKDTFGSGKLHSLERIAIEAMIHSRDTKDILRKKLREGFALNFFSHLVYEPKESTPDHGIFVQLENMLKEVGAKEIAIIKGTTSDNELMVIQENMGAGRLDALINQWDCTSEGFSETAGNRPVCTIPLRSPFEPGRHTQIIGRSYRPGQNAEVEYIELHAHSNELLKMIDSYVRHYAKEKDVPIKTTWAASLFHDDVYNIRRGKEEKIMISFTQRSSAIEQSENDDICTTARYARTLSKSRILDFSKRETRFGSGTRQVGKFVGRRYDEGLKENAELLGKDYHNEDIILYTPGKINLTLSGAIESIKEREGQKNMPWNILDLGCCSSAVFSQARIIYQAMEMLKSGSVGLDYIVSVDGQEGFVNNARHFLQEGKWTKAIAKLRPMGFTEEDMLEVQKRVRQTDYMSRLDFVVANFVKDKLPKADVIITSQCLQYNDQTDNRDIENILLNVNKSLNNGGHYLSVLTGNSRKRSFTSQQDIDSFRKILGSYGFRIEKYGHISGHKKEENKTTIKVLSPFHYFHAIKINDYTGLVAFDIIPPMYANVVERLTGGYRIESFRRICHNNDFGTASMPNMYRDCEGEEFRF